MGVDRARGGAARVPGAEYLDENVSAVHWARQEQHLGQEALDLTCSALASSSSEDQLRNRLNAIARQVSGIGASFVG